MRFSIQFPRRNDGYEDSPKPRDGPWTLSIPLLSAFLWASRRGLWIVHVLPLVFVERASALERARASAHASQRCHLDLYLQIAYLKRNSVAQIALASHAHEDAPKTRLSMWRLPV